MARSADARPPEVALQDLDCARADRVDRLIAACGAAAVRVGPKDWLTLPRSIRAAVIALAGTPGVRREDDAVLRAAKSVGVDALVYADGTARWDTATRCHVLLSGAAALLDSSDVNFSVAFPAELAALLGERAGASEDERRSVQRLAELGLVACSAQMRRTCQLVHRLAELSDIPVLIEGESGTGKELVARALHRLDPRRRVRPFVAVNCGAISVALAESELFGHVRGAFTGADRDRRGLLRAATGGVLFLDEIGEMSPELQAKLLRVLQDGEITPLGDERPLSTDVRIVAATNRDLGCMVSEGRFRADLFHRLNVVPVRIAALRERPDDVAPLIRHFVAKHQGIVGAVCPVEADFVTAMQQLTLPGNVRQLENIVRGALVAKRSVDRPLELRDLRPEIWAEICAQAGKQQTLPVPGEHEDLPGEHPLISALSAHGWKLAETVNGLERELICAALTRTGGNQTRAAELLGITPRSVYNKLRRGKSLPETAFRKLRSQPE